ncbi:MAG: Zn-dependent exopeptidase M28 [Actinobacteria bacterium]|jgi:hypothetical protein|nr:MAG: Zn-dependent exopeptidase M28 [Actinomycetota bacterium]
MKRRRSIAAFTAILVLALVAGMPALSGCGPAPHTGVDAYTAPDAGDAYPSRSFTDPSRAATLSFDASRAMEHIEQLSVGIGPRPAGSGAESEAAAYIEAAFTGGGYEDVVEQAFPSVGDHISRNIYVEDTGTQPEWVLIIGAHYDSAGGTGSPGANDNASGVGVVLELARVFRQLDNVPTLLFAAFASEETPEYYDEDKAGYGSEYMGEHLEEIEGEVIGMINLDMVGVGVSLDANAAMKASPVLSCLFAMLAGLSGVQVTMVRETWWSDNMPFEERGIPTLYLEWVPDYNYHSPRDTYSEIDKDRIAQSGRLVEGFLGEMDADVCRAIERERD